MIFSRVAILTFLHHWHIIELLPMKGKIVAHELEIRVKAEDRFVEKVERSTSSKIANSNYKMPTWRVGQPMPLELAAPRLLTIFKKKQEKSR